MAKQEHHPWDRKTYYKGAQPDTDPNLLGSSEKDDGTYYNASNMRQDDGRGGHYGSMVPIGGEELIDDGRGEESLFRCIGAFSVNEHLVEFWAHSTSSSNYPGQPLYPPYIIVDGQKVAESFDLGFTADHPLQGDVNESCVGGEVYVTDDNTTPKIFNVQDLLDSVGSGKYFGDYETSLNSVNLNKPADIPVVSGLLNIGSGLPVGRYRYALRYVTEDGDRTNWSAWTPMISVPRKNSSQSTHYPHVMTYSDDPDPQSSTAYGVIVKLRVTNLFGYDSIEVKREAWDDGQGPDFTPSPRIVYRQEISENEISVIDLVDPQDSNVSEEVTDTEDVQEQTLVESAKAIRYFNRRLHLGNVQTASKTVDDVVVEAFDTGAEAVAKVENIGKEGYNNAWNCSYRERYMSGEKYSFGLVFWDSLGGRSFTKEAVSNFQFPNRRDILDGDSDLYSYGNALFGGPGVRAVNVDGWLSRTFEVFDLNDAERKDWSPSDPIKNIADPDENTGTSKDGNSDPDYAPFTPTPSNEDVSGHSFSPIIGMGDEGASHSTPKGFSPNYNSMGVAFKGVSNIPSWAQAFSVVRSEPADRVVCQGIGMYSLIEADFSGIGQQNLLQKHLDRMWFYSSDIEAGMVDPDTVDDIKANPQQYEVQLVSPLGFFSEVYNFNSRSAFSGRHDLIDMISYATVIDDLVGVNAEINRTLNVSGATDAVGDFGIKDDFKSYTAFGVWRNDREESWKKDFGFPGGNRTWQLDNVVEQTSGGRGSRYLELRFSDDVYVRGHYGGNSERKFQDAGAQRFHEPWYMVNIVRKGAQVPDKNIDKYKPTEHYQKVESIIGRSDGSQDQSFELIDERWEDCIVPEKMPNEWRYLYVGGVNSQKRAWADVTRKSSSEISAIKTDIQNNEFWTSPDGVDVYGVYTYESLSDQFGDFRYYIQFDDPDTIPVEDDLIYVRYDDRMPLSVYGGGHVVAPDVFSPIDREAETGDTDAQFSFGAAFPYYHWKLNPSIFQYNRPNGPNTIQDSDDCELDHVRQLAVYLIAESKSDEQLKYVKGDAYSQQFFPLVHYVMRPHRNFDNAEDRVYSEYFNDYPNEKAIWGYGGFRFSGMRNPDMEAEPYLEFFSKPEVGFEEENDHCTLWVWSLPRAINTQDAPGLRTFPALNKFFMSDDQGEIKFAYDQMTDKGRNLFAITTHGVCMLMTKKSVLSDINADEVAYINSDQYISDEYWLSKEAGCRDHYWQGKAEGKIRMAGEGASGHAEVLLWPDRSGVYRMVGGQVEEVMRGKYSSELFNVFEEYLHDVQVGIPVPLSGVVDERNNEYWLHVQSEVSDDDIWGRAQRYDAGRHFFAFNLDTGEWVGKYAYSSDAYVFHNDVERPIGLRNAQAFLLDKGTQIRGEEMACSVEQISSGHPDMEHEWIRVRVNTNTRRGQDIGRPSVIEFMDEDGNVMCEISELEQGPYYLKLYDGWENFIPREKASYSNKRRRLQSPWLHYRIRFDNLEDLVLHSTNVQFKPLK